MNEPLTPMRQIAGRAIIGTAFFATTLVLLITADGWWRIIGIVCLVMFLFADEMKTQLDKASKKYMAQFETRLVHFTEQDLHDALWRDRHRAETAHGPGAWDVADVMDVLKKMAS